MKITLLEVRNFKRIKDITIEPGERSMLLIAGKNRQGKSSLMDAMTAALGGTRAVPDTPVRNGQKYADIRLEFDGGEFTVHRRITAKGKNTLTVTGPDGKLGKPQKVLDALVATRFLNPLEFMRLKGKDQRDRLLTCVDIGINLVEHAAKRKRVYDERSGFNSDIKELRFKVAEKEDPAPVPDEIDVSVVIDGLRALREVETAQAADVRKQDSAIEFIAARQDFIRAKKMAIEAIRSELEDAEHGLEISKKQLHAANIDVGTHVSDEDLARKVAEAEDAINTAADKNAERKVAIAAREAFACLADELKLAEREAKRCTRAIERIDDEKADALSAASMPVDGLDFDEDGVTYNGVPLKQASGAEQLQVALGLAAAMSPDLQDVHFTEGALLDEDSLDVVRAYAEANDLRVWLERVGTRDEGAIIISEGEIASATEAAA